MRPFLLVSYLKKKSGFPFWGGTIEGKGAEGLYEHTSVYFFFSFASFFRSPILMLVFGAKTPAPTPHPPPEKKTRLFSSYST